MGYINRLEPIYDMKETKLALGFRKALQIKDKLGVFTSFRTGYKVTVGIFYHKINALTQ